MSKSATPRLLMASWIASCIMLIASECEGGLDAQKAGQSRWKPAGLGLAAGRWSSPSAIRGILASGNIIGTSRLNDLLRNRRACRNLLCALGCSWLMPFHPALAQARKATPQSPPLSSAQVERGEGATPHRLEWRRHFQSQSGLSPVGVADDGGTLWLITHAGPGKPKEYVTRIDPEGNVTGNYDPQVPLNLAEWVSYHLPRRAVIVLVFWRVWLPGANSKHSKVHFSCPLDLTE